MSRIRSFPGRALAYGLKILERERPFFSFSALGMYALTLLAELPVIVVRYVVFVAVSSVVLMIEQHTLSPRNGSSTWLLLPLIPTLWSAIALLTPVGSGWWWGMRAGGRDPSTRERLAYQDAVELLQAHSDEPLPLPKRWFVIDTPHPDAAVVGNALMLSRGLFETDYVPAVLAHELGHLASPDGRLTAALNRLSIFCLPFGRSTDTTEDKRPRTDRISRVKDAHKRIAGPSDMDPVIDAMYGFLKLMFILSLWAKGGLGLWFTRPAWGTYWRRREYKADQHAASLGQAEELADFLEVHALIHDHPVPHIWLTEHTHPPTELRIDKLRNPAVPVAPVPGDVKGGASSWSDGAGSRPPLTSPVPSAGDHSGRQS